MAISGAERGSQIPSLSGVIERPRLLSKLDHALQHKITLICAPPGYGKTTIAAQFAHYTDHPVVWHRVEDRERDIPYFFEHCVAVLSEVAPSAASVAFAPGLTPVELAASVANHLRSEVQTPFVYVLDDLHALSGSSAVETWLRTFINLLPPNCHVIMISRSLPALPMTEMIARREMMAIGQDQLRFTADEIVSLADTLLGFRLPRANAEKLLEKLEGWPAGTLLALQPLPQDLEHLMLSGEGPEGLFYALADMMLNAQPPGLRDFLLASSTLPYITTELLDKVLGLPNVDEWLAEMRNRNLFITRAPAGLTYHRLFREFLQRRFMEQQPERFAELHRRAAVWFENKGDIDEAFTHYIAAGDAEQANVAIQSLIQAYFTQERTETLLHWNETLMNAGVLNPQLLYVCSTVLMSRYDYDTANAFLEDAERMYRRQGDEVGIANVQLHRAYINVQLGNYFQAISQVEQLMRSQPDTSKLNGRALRILGFANLKLGLVETAIQHLEQALELLRQTSDLDLISRALHDLEVAYLYVGQLSKAAACLQELVAIRRSIGSPVGLAQALNNLGYHYHQFGNYALAQATLEEGLSVISQVQDRRTEGYLLSSLGDLKRDRGGFDEALAHYNRALELAGSNEPALRCNLLISLSTLRRWQHHFYDAAALAEEAVSTANAHKLAFEGAMARATQWIARGFMGELMTAAYELDLAISELQMLHAKTEVVHVMTMRAMVSYLRNERTQAESFLKTAVQIAESGGSFRPLIAELIHHPFMEPLIPSGERYSAVTQGIAQLLKAQIKPTNIIRLEDKLEADTVYSLRIQTLGKEIIERDGVLVLTTDWRAAAAKELFFYLLFVGPDSRERISLNFWPESTSGRVRSNFHTTLYRVRQALGDNVIVFNDDAYGVNMALDIWCDAHEFMNLARQARPLSPQDAPTEDLWQRAAALYHGDFLPQLDSEWILAFREDLRDMYLECVVNLGLCAQARHDYRQAVRMFKQALKIDPYREEFHRKLMLCYAKQGERGRIQSHWRKLQTLFDEELAIEPSNETKLLVRSLLK